MVRLDQILESFDLEAEHLRRRHRGLMRSSHRRRHHVIDAVFTEVVPSGLGLLDPHVGKIRVSALVFADGLTNGPAVPEDVELHSSGTYRAAADGRTPSPGIDGTRIAPSSTGSGAATSAARRAEVATPWAAVTPLAAATCTA